MKAIKCYLHHNLLAKASLSYAKKKLISSRYMKKKNHKKKNYIFFMVLSLHKKGK
jgi:hypothetical protein